MQAPLLIYSLREFAIELPYIFDFIYHLLESKYENDFRELRPLMRNKVTILEALIKRYFNPENFIFDIHVDLEGKENNGIPVVKINQETNV